MKKVKMHKCLTSDEVCEFLTKQGKKYNLNVVAHWIVLNEGIYEVFYLDYEE